jgi:hypothetical protein
LSSPLAGQTTLTTRAPPCGNFNLRRICGDNSGCWRSPLTPRVGRPSGARVDGIPRRHGRATFGAGRSVAGDALENTGILGLERKGTLEGLLEAGAFDAPPATATPGPPGDADIPPPAGPLAGGELGALETGGRSVPAGGGEVETAPAGGAFVMVEVPRPDA